MNNHKHISRIRLKSQKFEEIFILKELIIFLNLWIAKIILNESWVKKLKNYKIKFKIKFKIIYYHFIIKINYFIKSNILFLFYFDIYITYFIYKLNRLFSLYLKSKIFIIIFEFEF